MDSTDSITSRPSSAAAIASETSPRPVAEPGDRPGRSLRFRLTVYLVGLLAVAAGILLLFVNAAAHLATIPIEGTLHIADPVNGFVIRGDVVDTAEAQARAETLSRLRLYSVLGFVAMVLGGFVLAWLIAGRALRPLTGMAAVARRISDRNLEERIPLEQSDEELRELASSFNGMVDRLDEAIERQRSFAGDASHELRTPLTALQISLDSVRSDPNATLEDYRTVAEEAAAATARMRRLVEDMLALAESGKPPPRSLVALAPLVDAVVEEMEALAAQRRIMLGHTVPSGLVAYADQLGLRRALRNLVENALRYNHEGGHVMVEHAAAPPGWVALAVRDDGIGIPAEAQPRIFDRFYRVDSSRSRDNGGSGLGLSIVAKIAAENGGRVDVESIPGEGSRFVLTLPVAAPPPEAAETSSPEH
jgi:signal transduction histidine kinase